MRNKAVDIYANAFEFVPVPIKLKKCVIDLSIFLLMQQNSFLNAIRLKKCALNLLILVLFYLILFLIDIRLKK